MKKGKGDLKITTRLGNITKWQPVWDMPNRNITLHYFTVTAMASRKMLEKPVNGTKKQPHRGWQLRNSIWAQCIFWARAVKKMNHLRDNSLKKQLFRETLWRN